MKKTMLIYVICFISIFYALPHAGLFDLSVEEIKDSISLIEQIKQSDNPLYPYFVKPPVTRGDIVAVINAKILPAPDFAYKATQLEELKYNKNFNSLSSNKKQEIMAKNRDLLTELFPNEILERNTKSIKQSFGLHIPIKKVDNTTWLKAEIVNFLNEILNNEKMLHDWEKLKPFFDSSVNEKIIKSFAEEYITFNSKKIPVNAIELQSKGNKVQVSIISRDDRKTKNLFVISAISKKKWKIIRVDNICNTLFREGYTAKKKVVK